MGSVQPDITPNLSETLKGFKVIIVGAGFAGLACASDLGRRGADVTVFEAADAVRTAGDIILFGPNATRIVSKYGKGLLEELMRVASQPPYMPIMDKHGKLLLQQEAEQEFDGWPNAYGYRGHTQNVMFQFAKQIGVKFVYNSNVQQYFEDDHCAGVIVDGVRHEADLVVGADGIHSRARYFVTGKVDKPQPSGFALYRAWFPLEVLRKNPVTKEIADAPYPWFHVWIMEDCHAIITTNKVLDRGTCFATHRDDRDIKEDWTLPGRKSDMLKVVEGCDERLVETVKELLEENLIDYKILWRDPIKPWVSSKGRVCIVGDAAHPHLATSATGGAQGVEDGATIAACLEEAGKGDVPTALRAFEKLRFERTSLTQRMGWELRHRWHQTDWDAVAKDPEYLKFRQPAWLVGVDAEDYAHQNYAAVVSHLKDGTPFTATNVPEGYVHEDWTVSELMEKEKGKADEEFFKVK
ncbi:putative MAK1-like monooxygenase [Fonsecaea pedrosoi]|nr:putative MAK1-like monooxygenase [Fonsecaea pedrosoi]